MKHGWLVFQGRGVFIALVGILVAAIPAAVRAQLHSGQNASYQAAAAARSGSNLGSLSPGGDSSMAQIRRGELQNAAIVNTGYIPGTKLNNMDMRDPELWARAIIHSDGSYTETRKDLMGNQTVTQRTVSANGVLLQERIIMADDRGFPSEVLIKDATGEFKYRGVLLYDRSGRFIEERLYNMKSELLRRRIQETGPKGESLFRVVDYAENIPADIQLVITEENAPGNNAEKNRRNYDRFAREAREVSARSNGEEKKGFFKRLFSRKKKS